METALSHIPKDIRDTVQEITLDLSSSLHHIVRMEFPKASKVIDRFHVQKLACDAIQEMRIKHRWEALDADHKRSL